MIGKVKIRLPKGGVAQLLKDWREDEDRIARAENSLMRYYLRQQKHEWVERVSAVAAAPEPETRPLHSTPDKFFEIPSVVAL